MNRRILIIIPVCILLAIVIFALLFMQGKEISRGRVVKSNTGSLIWVDDGGPTVLNIKNTPADIGTGDEVIMLHADAIAESYPMQVKTYYVKKTADGSESDISDDVLIELTQLGFYDYLTAAPATDEKEQRVYCGNTVTTIKTEDAQASFMGGDSVNLTDLLYQLDYTEELCKCAAEFAVITETDGTYEVNLTECYARHDSTQATLTDEQMQTIREIYDRQYTQIKKDA